MAAVAGAHPRGAVRDIADASRGFDTDDTIDQFMAIFILEVAHSFFCERAIHAIDGAIIVAHFGQSALDDSGIA